MEKRLILVGGGGFGRELISWLADESIKGHVNFDGFIDQDKEALEKYGIALSWLGDIVDFIPKAGDLFVLGVSMPKQKELIVNILSEKNCTFESLIHPTAIVAKSAVLSEGVILCPYSVVSANTTIGRFVTINVMSTIGHDAKLGDYSTLSSHVDLTGFCDIGLRVFFGSSARVTPKVKIGDDAVIGAGTTIIRSVAKNATMFAPFPKKL